MKQVLSISVFLGDSSKEAKKPVFHRLVYLDDSISVNYQSHIESLRFMFGSESIISFELSTY